MEESWTGTKSQVNLLQRLIILIHILVLRTNILGVDWSYGCFNLELLNREFFFYNLDKKTSMKLMFTVFFPYCHCIILPNMTNGKYFTSLEILQTWEYYQTFKHNTRHVYQSEKVWLVKVNLEIMDKARYCLIHNIINVIFFGNFD